MKIKRQIKTEIPIFLCMPIITPKSCTQIEFKSLEDYIEIENTVRFIDAFVEKLELDKLLFSKETVKLNNFLTNQFLK